jgi:hypothetical protein
MWREHQRAYQLASSCKLQRAALNRPPRRATGALPAHLARGENEPPLGPPSSGRLSLSSGFKKPSKA